MNRIARLAPAILLAAMLAACGGTTDSGDGTSQSSTTSTSAAASSDIPATSAPDADGMEPADDPTTEPEPSSESPPSTGSSPQVDLDQPPDPDADASADDFPDFEWAFEQGYQEGSYGRTDYYEPSSMSKSGSFAGLAARKAYYAGFAKGLADYQARSAAAASSSAAAQRSDEADGPVGDLLPGWDPKQVVIELWNMQDPATCDQAPVSEPCLDIRNTLENDVVAVARLDPAAGPDPDHAVLLAGQMRGYEVIEYWDASELPATPLPEWASTPRG